MAAHRPAASRRIVWLIACAVALAHLWALQHLRGQVTVVSPDRPGQAAAAAPMRVTRLALHGPARHPVAPLPRTAPVPATPSARTPAPAPREHAPLPTEAIEANEAQAHYVANGQLARGALPLSAPDMRTLDGVALSGLPLRLRLFVDAHGRVVQVLPLQVAAQDADAVQPLREMFMATAFMPGRLAGKDVDVYLDVELNVELDVELDGDAPPSRSVVADAATSRPVEAIPPSP